MLLRRASARCVSPALCLARLTSAAAAGRLIMNSLSQICRRTGPRRAGQRGGPFQSATTRAAQQDCSFRSFCADTARLSDQASGGGSVDRHLVWPDLLNARDLGGLRSASGGETAWRQVVRADNLNKLAPGGVAALVAYGVSTVIDLRDPREARGRIRHTRGAHPRSVDVCPTESRQRRGVRPGRRSERGSARPRSTTAQLLGRMNAAECRV